MNSRDGEQPSYLFAGDRAIAVSALSLLIDKFGHVPRALCISDRPSSSHASELETVFRQAGGVEVIRGSELNTELGVARLHDLALDFALSVHFPEIVRRPTLDAVKLDWLNLHPAYLPCNRGWHTPSWAILEGTPAGATIHVMVEDVDAGPILAQDQVVVLPDDTAHVLYQRLLKAEIDLLESTWSTIASGDWRLTDNSVESGTVHRRKDLLSDAVQRIDRDASVSAGELIDRLRALTTNDITEAAYFEEDGVRYRVRVEVTPDQP